MNKFTSNALLIAAAFIAPAMIVLVEWFRTVLGFFNLAPGVPYMPNGFENFYLFVAATMLIVGFPMSRRLIARGELRLAKHIRTVLAILIFWKVIDVTLISESPAALDGTAASLVLSLGTFAYGIFAGTIFWYIAVRPHIGRAQTELPGTNSQ